MDPIYEGTYVETAIPKFRFSVEEVEPSPEPSPLLHPPGPRYVGKVDVTLGSQVIEVYSTAMITGGDEYEAMHSLKLDFVSRLRHALVPFGVLA